MSTVFKPFSHYFFESGILFYKYLRELRLRCNYQTLFVILPKNQSPQNLRALRLLLRLCFVIKDLSRYSAHRTPVFKNSYASFTTVIPASPKVILPVEPFTSVSAVSAVTVTIAEPEAFCVVVPSLLDAVEYVVPPLVS